MKRLEREVPNLFLCLSDGFPKEIAFKTRGADESFKDNGPYEFETEELLTERSGKRLFLFFD